MKVKIAYLIIHYIVNPLRVFYWFVFRPETQGVKNLIEHDGEFLFIRNTYGSGRWTLPGGGVHRNESPEAAALRETKEEVSIDAEGIQNIGSFKQVKQYKKDTVHCFYSKASSREFRIDPYEILEARWAKLSEIPQPYHPNVDTILDFYRAKYGS